MRWLTSALLLACVASAQDEAEIRAAIAKLGSKNSRESFDATFFLQKNGERAAPHLVEALGSDDDDAYQRVERIVWKVMRHAYPHLQKGLAHTNASTRLACALILEQVAKHRKEPVSGEVVRVLVAGLADTRKNPLVLDALSQRGIQVEKALPTMRKLLQGADETRRAHAFRAYRDYGAKAAADIPFLTKLALEAPKSYAHPAAQALGHMGPRAIPSLRRILARGREGIAPRAVSSLGEQGPAAAAAVPLLLEMHARNKSVADMRALPALMKIAPDDPRVRKLLAEELRGRNAYEIVRKISLGKPENFKQELRTALDSKDGPTRWLAAQTLAGMGADVDRAVGTLIELAESYTDRQRNDRDRAIRTLLELGPPAGKAVPRLIALALKLPDMREEIVLSLPEMGRAALPGLGKALLAGGEARAIALEVLPLFGPLVVDVGAEIEKVGKDPKHGKAVQAIIDASAEFDASTPHRIVIDALKHEEAGIRIRAAQCHIEGIMGRRAGHGELLRTLLEASRSDKSEPVRALALMSFWTTTKATADVLPSMHDLLRSENPRIRAGICEAIAETGPKAALPDEMKSKMLDVLFGDPDEDVRASALNAVTDGGYPPDGEARMLAALKDKSAMTRAFAAIIARDFPDASAKTVPLVLQVLDHEHLRFRVAAMETLYVLGPKARAAVPKLKRMRAKEKDDRMKEVIDKVIEKIAG